MKNDQIIDAIGMINDKAVRDAKSYQRPQSRRWMRSGLTAACLAVILITVTTAVAAAMGYDLVGWIRAALARHGYTADPAVIQEQLAEGQWVYLNDDNIAVILPDAPTKILLSSDSGETWKEAVVEGSDKMAAYGELREGVVPNGGFIGFWDEGGYLVLTLPASMGNQPIHIYLTADGGDTWAEIGNPYAAGEHYGVVTGVGFSTAEIGFISYRYFEDEGPDIWWTSDGGDTWEELTITLPEEYAGDEYVFTPLSPAFHGSSGTYQIEALARSDESTEMICLYSDDYGVTWECR